MVKGQHLNTRISQEAYKKLMQKCADGGCSTYEYLRHLVYADVGFIVEEPLATENIIQTELNEENERYIKTGIRITG